MIMIDSCGTVQWCHENSACLINICKLFKGTFLWSVKITMNGLVNFIYKEKHTQFYQVYLGLQRYNLNKHVLNI